ncbi:hypothetical protein M434DRAFT_240272 [Hypoxylon sp. CO27-5]|nr:hypothetical protein M434DRAFT_240272 [Hypoxylon sp. CO27-5]
MPNTLKCLTVFSSHGNWISCKGVSVHHTDSFANTEFVICYLSIPRVSYRLKRLGRTRPYAVHFLLHDAAAKVYVHGSFTYSSTCMSSTLRRIPAWPASSRICHESLYQIPTTRGRSSVCDKDHEQKKIRATVITDLAMDNDRCVCDCRRNKVILAVWGVTTTQTTMSSQISLKLTWHQLSDDRESLVEETSKICQCFTICRRTHHRCEMEPESVIEHRDQLSSEPASRL